MVLPFAGKMGLVLLRDERLESSAGRQLCKSTHRKELKANVCSRQQCSLSLSALLLPNIDPNNVLLNVLPDLCTVCIVM